MISVRRALPGAYDLVVAVLLVLAVAGGLGAVLPGPVAEHVGEDSEALLLALGLPLWVRLARPRLAGRRQEWPVTLLTAAGLLALGLVLYLGPAVPGRVETLNETVLALAVLVPYVQLRRPLSRALPLGLSGGVLLLVLLASGTTLVTDWAEGLVMLVLAPVGLDLVDRAVLRPGRRSPLALRLGWYAFLVLAPLGVTLLEGVLHGGPGDAVRYAQRVQESFLGVLLVELQLAVLVPLAARRAAVVRPPHPRRPGLGDALTERDRVHTRGS